MPKLPRLLLGGSFIATGVLHFLRPRMYEAIVPDYLPAHRELVYASGVAEALGGAGVLLERTRRPAGWWLILTLLPVFPANVEMALHAERFRTIPEPLLWARLPVQAALIAWVRAAALRP
ncbi:MAG TPA: DoxX family membrane protein [Solirubrobacteraceae bacterium]|nr:DoxX family membrane protein [Solirubrobacteraceae bacterium]